MFSHPCNLLPQSCKEWIILIPLSHEIHSKCGFFSLHFSFHSTPLFLLSACLTLQPRLALNPWWSLYLPNEWPGLQAEPLQLALSVFIGGILILHEEGFHRSGKLAWWFRALCSFGGPWFSIEQASFPHCLEEMDSTSGIPHSSSTSCSSPPPSFPGASHSTLRTFEGNLLELVVPFRALTEFPFN